jgi:hypothetical protein
MTIILIISIIITIVKYPTHEFVSPYSFLPVSLLGFSRLFFPFHSSLKNQKSRHITNLTIPSNRTIDYLTESTAKPEAYQAHSRRISATKAANQKQQETKQEQESKRIALRKHQEATYADLFGFSVDFSARNPKFNGPHPASAPAAFASTNEHTAVVQGEIPIGVELPLPLSPMRDLELGC